MRWNTRAAIAAALALSAGLVGGGASADGVARAAGAAKADGVARAAGGASAKGVARAASVANAAGSSAGIVKPLHGLCSGASLRPTPANIARVATATLCLIEREREAHHLGLLRSNASLRRIAASQAKEMVVGDYFGDNSLAGGTPWQRITASHYASGAHGLAAAQNIGWGTEQMATPSGMVNIWMLSPPHREIMLKSGYRDIGVGVAPAAPSSLTGGEPGATYTVEFAVRR
jgi:uncharacterized protein YkwD